MAWSFGGSEVFAEFLYSTERSLANLDDLFAHNADATVFPANIAPTFCLVSMWLSFTGLMLENLTNEEAMIITKSEIVLNSIALKGLSPPAHSNHCQCLDEVILSDKPAGA